MSRGCGRGRRLLVPGQARQHQLMPSLHTLPTVLLSTHRQTQVSLYQGNKLSESSTYKVRLLLFIYLTNRKVEEVRLEGSGNALEHTDTLFVGQQKSYESNLFSIWSVQYTISWALGKLWFTKSKEIDEKTFKKTFN